MQSIRAAAIFEPFLDCVSSKGGWRGRFGCLLAACWRDSIRRVRLYFSISLQPRQLSNPRPPYPSAPGDGLLLPLSLTSSTSPRFFYHFSCHHLTIDAVTIAHPVPSTITFTAPPSSSSHRDSLPTRHNTSLILLTSATLDPFIVACPNITFSLQESVFLIHLSATPTLSLFVSGYCSAVDQ